MSVQLSSLRVTADMDVSAYTRAMAEKVAADRQGAASSSAVGAALAKLDAGAEQTAAGMKRLSGNLLEGYKAGSSFEKAVRDIGRAVDTGMSLDRAQVLLDAAYRKFGLVADAAQLARQGFVSIAPAIASLNEHYRAQAETQDRASAAARAQAEAQRELKQRLEDTAAASARAREAQADINARLGVTDGGSNAARAADIEAFGREYDRYVQGLVKVREAEDELARARARNAQSQINASLGVRDDFGSARRAADVEAFAKEYDAYAKSLLRARQEEEALARARAQAAQAQVNTNLGVRDNFNTSARAADIQALGDELDRARAKYDPLWVAAKRYEEAVSEITAKSKLWGISEEHTLELVRGQERAFKATVGAIQANSAEIGMNRNQWGNLGYQVNDVVTMLLSGSNPFQVLATQGGQVVQILSEGQGGIAGSLKSIGGYLISLVTPATVAGTALAAVGVSGALAYSSWRDAQREIAQSLTGIGRASGSTADSINAIATAASAAGQGTVGAARQMATALASTGMVGDEMIRDLVMRGKDIAKTFGVDAAGASEILSQSFSDPARGIEQLNTRLGAFNAATVSNVQSLTAQNRLLEAQRVLYEGLKANLASGTELTSGWGRMWDTAAAAASRYWAAAGRGIDRQWGTGGTTQDQIGWWESRLAELQAIAARRSPTVNQNLGTTAEIERARAEIERLRNAMAEAAAKSAEIKANLDSIRAMGEIRIVMPELDIRRALEDRARFLNGMAEDPVAITNSGLSTEQVRLAAQRAEEMARSFKTQQEQAVAQAELANRAITARSPVERANLAAQQKALELSSAALSPAEKQVQIQQAYNNALKEGNFQLSEAGRQRLLAVQDSIGAAQAEIDGIGKTAREAELLRLNWQAYADLRREAAQNNTSIDLAQLERIKAENAELVKRKELLAERTLENDLGFERRQLGRTDTEQRVASTLRSYGLAEDLNSYQAGLIRMNEQLALTKELGSDFASTFMQSITSGASAVDSLNAALGRVADRLLTLAMDQAWTAIFNNSSGFLSQMLSPFFGGVSGGSLGTVGATTGAVMMKAAGGPIVGPGTGTSDSIPAWLSNGEYVTRASAAAHPQNRRILDFMNAGGVWSMPGFAAGGMVGGASASAATGSPMVKVDVHTLPGTTADVQPRQNADGTLSMEVIMRQVDKRIDHRVASDLENRGPIARKFEGGYGVTRQLR